jgi:hypothetical protein
MKYRMITEKEKRKLSDKEKTVLLYWEYKERYNRKGGETINLIAEGIFTTAIIVFGMQEEDFPKMPKTIIKQTYYEKELVDG